MRYYNPEFVRDFEGIAARLREFWEEVNGSENTSRQAKPEVKPSIPAELFMDDKNVYVELEIPGRRKEDIHLSLHDNKLLEVTVDKAVADSRPGATRVFSDRNRAGISREIPIPSQARIDADRISASYADGVLTITIGRIGQETRTVDIG